MTKLKSLKKLWKIKKKTKTSGHKKTKRMLYPLSIDTTMDKPQRRKRLTADNTPNSSRPMWFQLILEVRLSLLTLWLFFATQ